MKKLVPLTNDIKVAEQDKQILSAVDSYMRENSTIAGITTGFTVSVLCAMLASFNNNSNHYLYGLRLTVAFGMLIKINWLFDQGSHFGMFLGMPVVFDLLLNKTSENSRIRQLTLEFLEEI